MATYPSLEQISSVGVVGAGSVGASWTALLLAYGVDVIVHDPQAGAQARAQEFVTHAWPALRSVGIAKANTPPLNRLRFVSTVAEAAAAGDCVLENVPEKPAVKDAVLSAIDGAASSGKIITSSTGGIPPTTLQRSCRIPERFVVAHPFNPAHLVPLVEVIGGQQTAPAVIDWAMQFCRALGKEPIRLNREATGHMANRLQFALVREAVHCLVEGLASAEDIDKAVRFGLGPRWALMGSLLTLHLAGGPGGMNGILDHAGDAIQSWWDDLGNPRLTPDVRARLGEAAAEVSGGRSIPEWVQWRDEKLAGLVQLIQRPPNYQGKEHQS